MVWSAHDSMAPGQVVAERYRVLERLGAGGMGTVYRVEHVHMVKELAMKLLRTEVSGSREAAERFEREARSAARLDSPHIVRVTDFGRTEDGALYLVMELLEGELLSARIRGRGALPVAEALEIADQLLAGLEHAHGMGVIHRDMKPDNVMLVPRGEQHVAKILDFGLAKMLTAEEAEEQPLTRAGMVFGTPRYMAPEQAASEPTDERSDIYAVGVMLFELLTGKPPFTGSTAVEILRAHLTQPPPHLALPGEAPELVERLDAVVQAALAKDPPARLPNVRAFREALAACRPEGASMALSATAIPVTPRWPSTPPPLAPASPLRTLSLAAASLPPRLVMAGGGLALLLLVVLAGLGLGLGRSGGAAKVPEAPRPPALFAAALEAGELERARAVLERLRAEAPAEASTHLAAGHLAFAEGRAKEGVEAYLAALAADADAPGDPRFTKNLLALHEGAPRQANRLLRAVVKDGGPGAAPLLVALLDSKGSPAVRRRAYAGLARLEAVSQAPRALEILLADLDKSSGDTCDIRKWYVEQLVTFDDPRVVAALERQAKTASFGRANACMESLLKEQLERLAVR